MKILTPSSRPSLGRLPANFPSGPAGVDLLSQAIDLALTEDLGQPPVDLTSEALIDSKVNAKAGIYCLTNNAVIAGIPILEQVFCRFSESIIVSPLVAEGEQVKNNTPLLIAQVTGNAKAILAGERIALNLLQRMCAVATTTSQFVEKAKKFNIAILDTRKTTPGLRVFEKYAVLAAGGTNHRFGLYDAILIKDNHIKSTGGIKNAVTLVRTKYPGKSIEVECTSLAEVEESLGLSVERIMLDNLSPNMVKEALGLIKGKSFVEISGGINMSNIDGYFQTGVNAISIGALTHSSVGVDISLELE